MAIKRTKKLNVAEQRIIGRNDIVDFPELGLTHVRVKVDTGAYTSSIHCFKVSVEEGKLTFFLPAHRSEKHQQFSTEHFELKAIKNSFGQTEMRYVIKTKVILFGKPYETFSRDTSTRNRPHNSFRPKSTG